MPRDCRKHCGLVPRICLLTAGEPAGENQILGKASSLSTAKELLLSLEENCMTKDQLRKLVLEYGDAIITYRSLNSNKLKYNVCTLDFDTPYIKAKKNKSKECVDTLLLFCWDTDTYRLIRPSNIEGVSSVVPLSRALRNRDEY